MQSIYKQYRVLLSAWVVSLITTAGWSQSLTWLGTLDGTASLAEDVSADGKVVVGAVYNASGYVRAFRWTQATGMQDLGTLGGQESWALGVSADGSVVVGGAYNASNQYRAFRWTAATGMVDLGTLGGRTSWANDVSANGRVVVGTAQHTGGFYRAFRWTQETGMQNLGAPGVIARGVSANGAVVVGELAYHAFRWTQATGIVDLGTLGGSGSSAWGISVAGTMIVGWAHDTRGRQRAFRWTQAEGMRDLGVDGFPSDISADGSVVVGTSGNYAFHWCADTDRVQSLNITYASLLTNGSYLRAATAISPDGRYIVGWGYNGVTRRQEAFLLDTCPGGDTDNDCLCDDWERNGLDINGDGTIDLNLPALGAQVGVRDIFVEYDSMAGLAPNPAALQRVVAAFQARNIALHIQNGGDQNIPVADWPDHWTSFDATKSQFFGTPAERGSPNWANIRRAKRRVFRYCVFASTYGGGTSGGMGEIPGDDFMVTLGHPNWQALRNSLPAVWNGVNVSWDDHVAGTFMHELGHTLGFRHGGDTWWNFKPNYHSVMNYLWQRPQPGYAASWVLDYSGGVFNALDETNLNEAAGIGGHAGHRVPIGGRDGRLVPESGPVDWNSDGDTADAGVRMDANGDGSFTVLQGYDDWANLDLPFSCCGPNWADGVHMALRGSEADLEEMDFATWLALARIGLPPGDANFDGCLDDADLLAVLFAFGQTGNRPEDVNDDGIVDDADLLMVLFHFGQGC
ncbi:MAG: hypothetical protein N2045_10415 [Fimbriimonadales bacterium]|nr:hypothetical protein [Fimbriimonadales bacterium]